MSYCTAIPLMKEPVASLHRIYHDKHYGFPIKDDDELFCRLILEINQAGLSWTTILQKQDNFRKAYSQFQIKKVAGYKEKDFQRLMNDSGIIRNKLKIHAAIENAKTIKDIQKTHGSFLHWLHGNHPKTKTEWRKLFKNTFRFTGGEIVNEFLVSSGFLPGAHDESCPVFKKIINSKPAWLQTL